MSIRQNEVCYLRLKYWTDGTRFFGFLRWAQHQIKLNSRLKLVRETQFSINTFKTELPFGKCIDFSLNPTLNYYNI